MFSFRNLDFYEDKLGLPSPTTQGRKIPEMFDGAVDGSLKALWIFAEDVVQTFEQNNQLSIQ